MSLLRALHAELLKLKRTIALWMVLVAPAVIFLLTLLLASQAPYSILHRSGIANEWQELTRFSLRFWVLLMMPLLITLEASLIAGLEHAGGQWKSLLARPLPRWALYVAKLIVIIAMTATSTLLLAGGILLNGAILPRIQPAVFFSPPVPWAAILQPCAQVAGLAFLMLTIQYWVSVRWRSFSVPIGMGIVGLVIGVVAAGVAQQAGGWPFYFPWAMPAMAIARQTPNIGVALGTSLAAGLAVTAAGCADFCRRDVQ